MKPHIVKIRGIWYCGNRGIWPNQGEGFTVRDAYYDWVKRNTYRTRMVYGVGA